MSAALRIVLLSALVGVLAGCATAAFLFAFNAVAFVVWTWVPRVSHPYIPSLLASGAAVFAVAVAIGALLRWRGRPTEPEKALHDYLETGHIEPRTFALTAAWSALSLGSGGAIGPEAPIVDITGGFSGLIAERLRLDSRDTAVLTCAAVSGAFAALFGSPVAGVLFGVELLHDTRPTLERLTFVASLAAAATGFATAATILGRGFEPIYVFPHYALPRLQDLLLAVPIGLLAACIGVGFTRALHVVRSITAGLRARPSAAVFASAASVVIAASVSPRLLFSGQAMTDWLLRYGARLGVLALVALAATRLGLAVWQLSTGYYGGTIFPLITAGAAVGVALNVALPAIPPGVAVVSVIAGVLAGSRPIPLGITVLLGAVSQASLVPVAAVAAISAAVLRRSVDTLKPVQTNVAASRA